MKFEEAYEHYKQGRLIRKKKDNYIFMSHYFIGGLQYQSIEDGSTYILLGKLLMNYTDHIMDKDAEWEIVEN